MVEYAFYTDEYHGDSISSDDWPTYEARAEAVIERFKRIYTVTSPTLDGEANAICAVADAMCFFDEAVSGGVVTSSSIGSVSSSTAAGTVDVSPRAQNQEYYRSASMYLDIYRGVN